MRSSHRARRAALVGGLAVFAAVGVGAAACNVSTVANCSTNSETGAERGPEMAPGSDCMSCHGGGRGRSFQVAGTIMGAYKDSTQCDGVSGATVTITDATGRSIEMTSNSVGNFFDQTYLTPPYTAKVSLNGKEVAMKTPQTDGACGSCHTETGANGAPGRIVPP